MATNQSTTSTNIPPAASEIATELQNTLTSADTLAAQRVQNLQLVHQARLSRLNRELAGLQAQKAPESDVKAAESAVAAATYTAGRAAVVHLQLATAQPEAAATGWVLNGRVFDANQKPVSGFTVFLVDAQKSYQKDLGFAFTDNTGYFLINFSGSQSTTDTPSAKNHATKQQAAAAQQLFLEVADTQAQPVYLSGAAFEPAAGSVTYQNITLLPGNQPIGDPPAEIRSVAMPPDTKKQPRTRSRPKRGG
jgi:hypothetical protein